MFCQIERGTTATYLSSAGGNTAAMVRLQTIRNDTDRFTTELDAWPPEGLVVYGTHLPNKQVRCLSDSRMKRYRATTTNLPVLIASIICYEMHLDFCGPCTFFCKLLCDNEKDPVSAEYSQNNIVAPFLFNADLLCRLP